MYKLILSTAITFVFYSCVNEPEMEYSFDGPTVAKVGPDNNLYVGDGYYNSRIAVFNLKGEFIRQWGAKGYGKNQFQNPHGLAFSSDGSLLVADRDNGRIQKYSLNGNYILEWHSNELGRPWDIDVSEDGSIFSIDGGDQDGNNPKGGIVKLNSNGEIICRFSSFGTKPGELNWGHSITVSNDGKDIFVVDLENSRIQKFTASSPEMKSYNVVLDWPMIGADQLNDPLGITFKDDIIYVTQKSNKAPILLLDKNTGSLIKKIAGGIFNYAHGISVDKENTIWVTDKDNNKVYRLDMDGNIILTIRGTN